MPKALTAAKKKAVRKLFLEIDKITGYGKIKSYARYKRKGKK